eukprot:SAG25_NODE_1362_length_3200_cov_1.293776_3_plen_50_part_00
MQQRGVLSVAADARPSNPTREEEEEEDACDMGRMCTLPYEYSKYMIIMS